MRQAAPLVALALLAGCGEKLSPAEKARRDAADVAFVEAAQKQRAPAKPIAPQVLTAQDRGRLPEGENACGLVLRDHASDDPVLVLGPVAGHMKLEGKLLVLAADTGSLRAAPQFYRKYDGKTYALETGMGEGNTGWMTVRDSPGRVVFSAAGVWTCAAAQ